MGAGGKTVPLFNILFDRLKRHKKPSCIYMLVLNNYNNKALLFVITNLPGIAAILYMFQVMTLELTCTH